MSRCWAANPIHGRCGLDAGHDGDHSITHSWSDGECVDPEVMLTRTGGNDVPIVVVSPQAEVRAIPDPMPHRKKCFSCGHAENVHDTDGGCVSCDCLGFVP